MVGIEFDMRGDTRSHKKLLVCDWTGRTRLMQTDAVSIGELKVAVQGLCGIAPLDQVLSSPFCGLGEDAPFAPQDFAHIHVSARCVGGKGGFGAMLRGQSSRPGMKQVTPNTGAMRDLSGRRLRHVEQEQKLAEWQADAEKRKAEKEAEKKAKRQKVWDETHKQAEDYVAEAGIDTDEVTAAVRQGLDQEKHKKDLLAAEKEQKRKAAEAATKSLDALWGGEDDESSSGADEEEISARKPASTAEKSSSAQKAPASELQVVPGSSTEEAPADKSANDVGCPEPPKADCAQLEDINVDAVESLEKLVSMGGDKLKFALSRRGLKCGGTPEQRAERLWSVKGLPKEKWDKKFLVQASK